MKKIDAKNKNFIGGIIMNIEERLLFLEQVVSILIADRYGYDLDKEKEDMLDELCEEKFFVI